MLPMDAENAVTAIVEAMLPGGTTGKILHIALSAELWLYDEDAGSDNREHRMLHFLFYRPTNYTKVLFLSDSILPSISGRLPKDLSQFAPVSDHDSCWRSDGVSSPLSKEYFEMAELIIARSGKKGVAPKDLSYFTHFPKIELLEGEIKFVFDSQHRWPPKVDIVLKGE